MARRVRRDPPEWESVRMPTNSVAVARRVREKLLRVGLPDQLRGVIRMDVKRVGLGQVLTAGLKALEIMLDEQED